MRAFRADCEDDSGEALLSEQCARVCEALAGGRGRRRMKRRWRRRKTEDDWGEDDGTGGGIGRKMCDQADGEDVSSEAPVSAPQR